MDEGATMYDIKVARHKQVPVPEQVCLRCFNAQQQLGFPFLVYCAHTEVLAVIHSTEEYVTFHCAPEQLASVLQKLQSGVAREREAGEVKGR
ncbi:MAG TPA: hypothetical protein VIL43_11905 [Burkholderiales bacterium]